MRRAPSWVKMRRALFITAVAAGAAVYVEWFQPWFRRWGATDDEIADTWPADSFLEDGVVRHTRAITIDAPPATVWTWLAQVGQDQAGFYSYTVLENLVGAGMRNVDEVHPEWARRVAGDTVWLADPDRWSEVGRQVLLVVEPPRAFVMVSPPDFERVRAGERASGYWGFRLEPLDDGRTRLLTRASGGAVGTPVFDLLHFVMEQAMMRGIKRRAEATSYATAMVAGE
jgi:hypothetical protein